MNTPPSPYVKIQPKPSVRTLNPAAEEAAKPPSAIQKRAAQPLLVVTWSVEALRPRLPFAYPADPNLPPSPKSRYRSAYQYPGPGLLLDEVRRQNASEFEVGLHLVDFSPLRPILAQGYKPSRKGQVPFDPVSMFLACCLRHELKLSWSKLAKLLAGEHGARWRALLGFREGDTPSASGLRYFFHKTDPKLFAELSPSFIDLLHREGLAPVRSTYPGDPPKRGVTISVDGMLHPARSRPSCQLATEDCYQPLPDSGSSGQEASGEGSAAGEATPQPKRPCRAQERGLEGCACHPPACQLRCRRASALDPEARFVHHEWPDKRAGKQGPEATEHKGRGLNVFGYLSEAERLIDDRFAVAWTLRSRLRPANASESSDFPERIAQLQARFPDLPIGEVLADSGQGYPDCLEAIWQVGALRMVDIRAAEGDANPEACLQRGYDGEGHPLCAHGYPLYYQGYEAKRRRATWVCRRACRRKPRREGEPVRPVEGCPYLEGERPLGQIVHVGKTLPDGSLRLAREIPYGSKVWKARYGRRSLSESRNGQVQGMDEKRMRSCGLGHNERDIQVTDWLGNLRTLGRLVKEASALQTRRGG
ncbi:MAG: hypothetical protein QME94_11945 [Anaerolineae bacterium]|nr:hypothetical protein [Anaerolineae bacterium]